VKLDSSLHEFFECVSIIGMNNSRSSLRVIYLLIVLVLLTTLTSVASAADKSLLYVGTYTENTHSKGIYVYRFDPSTGESTPLGLAAETTNPSFLALHPNGKYLYAVNEVQKYQGPNSGGVSAFSINQETGKLTFLNEVPSRGADPCYVIVDADGTHVLVANYTGGSIAVFPVLEDGRLGEATTFVQHHGHGSNSQRQEGPHAHSIDLSPDQHHAYVDDLGLDEVLVYDYYPDKNRSLGPDNPPFAQLDPGAGPRHFALHPSGKFAYVVAEMASTVTAFSVDLKTGTLNRLQTLSTLPKDFKGENDDAEIRIHPNGKFLYASNRGHDSIAVFAIDPAKGTLTKVDDVLTQGKIPRSFEIDPTGKYLLAENQQSDDIVVFRIDESTGRLTPAGQKLDVPSPVCVKFLKMP
jgi:6-phosphogluconolactonase